MKSKLKNYVKDNYPILILLFVLLIIHILALKSLGVNYNINSDDIGYINSGLRLIERGTITMHGVISAQIMPGMTFFIALISLIFGKGLLFMGALKVLWMIMGLLTVYTVYRSIRLYTNKWISIIPCLFFLSLDYVWMNNLILTETPFILIFALLVYHTLKIAKEPNKKDYILIVIYYIIGVFIRPNIAIYPIFLFLYLLIKKYDFKLLMRQCLIAGGVLIVVLIPWIYRNYKLFDKFFIFTYGVGNPLLLGTYQGYGYPSDSELDYNTNVYDVFDEKMAYYLDNYDPDDYMSRYYVSVKDEMLAKYRMREWWKKDKWSMIKSYLYHKPKSMLVSPFYWYTVFNVSQRTLLIFRIVEFILFLICSCLFFLEKVKFKEWLFLMFTYGSQLAVYAYTFAFSRYAISLYFIRYIVIGIGLGILFNKIKGRSKNESINDNSSIQRRRKHS